MQTCGAARDGYEHALCMVKISGVWQHKVYAIICSVYVRHIRCTSDYFKSLVICADTSQLVNHTEYVWYFCNECWWFLTHKTYIWWWSNLLKVLWEIGSVWANILLIIHWAYMLRTPATCWPYTLICSDTLHRNVWCASNRSNIRSVYIQCVACTLGHMFNFSLFCLKLGCISTYWKFANYFIGLA